MQQRQFITQPPPRAGSRLAHLRAGDSVLVWDSERGRDRWQRVAETRIADSGRLKLKVRGTQFFFDEALVVSYMRPVNDRNRCVSD